MSIQSASVSIARLHFAARQHGNTERSPLLYWNPGAGNPYRQGTQYHSYYERIRALNSATATADAVPGAALMFQSLRHPTQRFGVPFHLDRAEYYRSQGTLIGIEVATTSSLGNGYVDLLLSDGTAIDCKAWTNFNYYST
ncbi:MAG: hypothetical protein RMJ56_01830, partial [Gemmataceae bacterium]|nr:hypothetical protein [Gemmata sp.]MDW8196323.1 hypothetical protein [Gemmataceae bacterium]